MGVSRENHAAYRLGATDVTRAKRATRRRWRVQMIYGCFVALLVAACLFATLSATRNPREVMIRTDLSLGAVASAAGSAAAVPLTIIDGTSANHNGELPRLENGVLTGLLHGGVPTGRSEVMWGDENQLRLIFQPGDTVTVEFEVNPEICGPNGELPPDRQAWHVVYQLHGALTDNTWVGPPVTLVWERGLWFVRGGMNVKLADGSMTREFGSQAPVTPAAPCGMWQRWKFAQVIGGPGVGLVDAWLDGEQIIAGWKPAAGTFYSGEGVVPHSGVQIKNGIYAGGTTAWPRTVSERGMTVTRQNASGVKTWTVGGGPGEATGTNAGAADESTSSPMPNTPPIPTPKETADQSPKLQATITPERTVRASTTNFAAESPMLFTLDLAGVRLERTITSNTRGEATVEFEVPLEFSGYATVEARGKLPE